MSNTNLHGTLDRDWTKQSVVVIRYVRHPPGNGYTQAFAPSHDRDYFLDLFFDVSAPLTRYFLEISGGNWRLDDAAGVYVTENVYQVNATAAGAIRAGAITAAAAEIDYTAYVKDSSTGIFGPRDVVIVLVGATNYGSGQNGFPSAPTPYLQIPGQNAQFAGKVPGFGEWASPQLIAHEMIHALGVDEDLYGLWIEGARGDKSPANWNMPGSIMGQPAGWTHLDPQNRARLGWDTVVSTSVHAAREQRFEIAAPTVSAGQPVLISDPERSESEFFIAEYRTSEAASAPPGHFDRSNGERGIALWHVEIADGAVTRRTAFIKPSRDASGHLRPLATASTAGDDERRMSGTSAYITWGVDNRLDTTPVDPDLTQSAPMNNLYSSPNGALGERGYWRGEHGAFRLRWADGTDAHVSLSVNERDADADKVVLMVRRDAVSAVYGVNGDGSLVWYRHEGWLDGSGRWANGAAETVLVSGRGPGSGWAQFKHVVSAGDGVLYGVKGDGSLVWYRHEGWLDGSGRWANGAAETVLVSGRGRGSGWAQFKHVVSAGDGVLYGVKGDGSLVWYRHEGWLDGSGRWANGASETVLVSGRGPGSGWAQFKHVVSAGDGVLYGVKGDGSLVWYRHEGWLDGSGRWANGAAETVLVSGRGPGSGWAQFKHVVSAGDGVLYGVKGDGSLVWYRHEGWLDGSGRWANGAAETVLVSGRGPGSGWAQFEQVTAQS